MSTFGALVTGCQRLGEIPTGSSIMELKERAAVAAQKAQHHAAAGHQALARSWNNAAARLRKELQSRLKETSLGELAELSFGTPSKVLFGATALGAVAYGAYQQYKKWQASPQNPATKIERHLQWHVEHAEET